MTSSLLSVTFKRASEVFIEETNKNFEFITEMLIRLLGFADPSCNRKPDFGTSFE